MIKIITLENIIEWREIVKSFGNKDVYYLAEYVSAFEKNGDGEAQLIYYNKDNVEVINVVVKRDIADHPNFKEQLPKNTYFDFITPYGYGGFLFKEDYSQEQIKVFIDEYIEHFKNHNIVSEFVRFHPVLDNVKHVQDFIETSYLGPTVTMNTSSEENIWKNIAPKNKTSIRKSIKNNVQIYWGRSEELLDEFVIMYEETMQRDNANSYYYFNKGFYKSILEDLKYNSLIFYAKYMDNIISMALIIFSNKYINYHLSASKYEYRNLAPSNLLLYEVSRFAYENGFKYFHLGGGLGSKMDSLYKFKKSFSNYEDTKYNIGKIIYNKEIYNKLTKLANIEMDDQENDFFPKYRSEKK